MYMYMYVCVMSTDTCKCNHQHGLLQLLVDHQFLHSLALVDHGIEPVPIALFVYFQHIIKTHGAVTTRTIHKEVLNVF